MHARLPNFLQYLILKLFNVYVIVVDGAIHRAAGPNLLKENREHGGCKDGEAVISGGYRLPAKCELTFTFRIWKETTTTNSF